MDIPDHKYDNDITLNDFALIDELSGLNTFLENFMQSQPNMPEVAKQRIRARMFVYQGVKPKEIAMNEMRQKIFGGGR